MDFCFGRGGHCILAVLAVLEFFQIFLQMVDAHFQLEVLLLQSLLLIEILTKDCGSCTEGRRALKYCGSFERSFDIWRTMSIAHVVLGFAPPSRTHTIRRHTRDGTMRMPPFESIIPVSRDRSLSRAAPKCEVRGSSQPSGVVAGRSAAQRRSQRSSQRNYAAVSSWNCANPLYGGWDHDDDDATEVLERLGD